MKFMLRHRCLMLSSTAQIPVSAFPLHISKSNIASWMKTNRLPNRRVGGSYCTIQRAATEELFLQMSDGIDGSDTHKSDDKEPVPEHVALRAKMHSNHDPATKQQQQGMIVHNNCSSPTINNNHVHPCLDLRTTKFGKRQKIDNDRRNNNARVRNSYLKLLLADAVLDQLHHATCQLKRQWELERQPSNKDNAAPPVEENGQVVLVAEPTIIRSKKQINRQLVTILPRSRSSLHMTFFFVGKVLDHMTNTDIQRWQTAVKECVSSMDCSSDDEDNKNSEKKDYSVQFKSLTTFPPKKNNLLVATFDPSIALEKLHEKLWLLALSEKSTNTTASSAELGMKKDYEFPLMRDLMLRQQKERKQRWIAHVTLASIVGGTNEERNSFVEWVNDGMTQCSVDKSTAGAGNKSGTSREFITFAEKELTALQSSPIHALGVALGGPIPDIREQILDWNFPFSGAMATTNTNESAEL